MFVAMWWRGKFNLKPVKTLSVDWKVARQLTSIGIPAILEQGVIQIAFLAFFAGRPSRGFSAAMAL